MTRENPFIHEVKYSLQYIAHVARSDSFAVVRLPILEGKADISDFLVYIWGPPGPKNSGYEYIAGTQVFFKIVSQSFMIKLNMANLSCFASS